MWKYCLEPQGYAYVNLDGAKYLVNKTTETYMTFNVLFTYSSQTPYADAYQKLSLEHKYATFNQEEGNLDQLMFLINQGITMQGSKYFCFMVDDMIFFDYLNFEDAINALLNQPDALTVHLKLYPGVTYSHTNDKLLPLPAFEPEFSGSYKWLKFRRDSAKLDWNYPFDFCGSFYRFENVLTIFNAIDDKSKMLKPNHFEFIGNSRAFECTVSNPSKSRVEALLALS